MKTFGVFLVEAVLFVVVLIAAMVFFTAYTPHVFSSFSAGKSLKSLPLYALIASDDDGGAISLRSISICKDSSGDYCVTHGSIVVEGGVFNLKQVDFRAINESKVLGIDGAGAVQIIQYLDYYGGSRWMILKVEKDRLSVIQDYYRPQILRIGFEAGDGRLLFLVVTFISVFFFVHYFLRKMVYFFLLRILKFIVVNFSRK